MFHMNRTARNMGNYNVIMPQLNLYSFSNRGHAIEIHDVFMECHIVAL